MRVVLAISLLTGCCFADPHWTGVPPGTHGVPAACSGTWTGVGVQPGYPPWPVQLTILPGTEPCGSIEYPSLGCGGPITNCALTAGGGMSADEVYTHTTAQCAPPGHLVLTCTPPTMDWTWAGSGDTVRTTLQHM